MFLPIAEVRNEVLPYLARQSFPVSASKHSQSRSLSNPTSRTGNHTRLPSFVSRLRALASSVFTHSLDILCSDTLHTRFGRAALQRRVHASPVSLSSRGASAPEGSAFLFVCHPERRRRSATRRSRRTCCFYPPPTIHCFRLRHGRVTSLASAMLRMISDVLRSPHSTRPSSPSQREKISAVQRSLVRNKLLRAQNEVQVAIALSDTLAKQGIKYRATGHQKYRQRQIAYGPPTDDFQGILCWSSISVM